MPYGVENTLSIELINWKPDGFRAIVEWIPVLSGKFEEIFKYPFTVWLSSLSLQYE